MVLYIHGFASSSNSRKALLLEQFFKSKGIGVLHPTLPVSPLKVVEYLNQLFSKFNFRMIVGSSLGGFYALIMAKNFNGNTVLINPAITPSSNLADYIGLVKRNYSEDYFYWTKDHINQLKELENEQDFKLLNQEKLYFFLAKDDELLDLSNIPKFFPQAHIFWYSDAKHAFVIFDKILPTLYNLYLQSTR